MVDGQECNSCNFVSCAEGTGNEDDEGIQFDCENIEAGLSANSCESTEAMLEEGHLLEFFSEGEFETCSTGTVAPTASPRPTTPKNVPTTVPSASPSSVPTEQPVEVSEILSELPSATPQPSTEPSPAPSTTPMSAKECILFADPCPYSFTSGPSANSLTR